MDLRQNIFLIGKTISLFNNKKLPTNKEVLQLLYHHTRNLNKSVDDSCSLVINKVIEIWSTAEIPTQANSRCIQKLKNLYREYRNVQKHLDRKNKTEEQNLSNKLEQLFDIAHGNVFEMIDEVTKQFLIDQRSQRMFHLSIAGTGNKLFQIAGNVNENI